MQGQTRWSIPPRFVMYRASLIDALAGALLAGEPAPNILYDRCRRTLGRRWRWLRPLTQRYVDNFGTETRPRYREVAQFLREDAGLWRAWAKYADELVVTDVRAEPQLMLPTEWSRNVPRIESTGDLAKWLGLSPSELRWFADLRGLGYKQHDPRLEHYHYHVLAKRFGTIRLIEAPKPRLKDLQRQILLWVLQKLPAHPAGHGFVKERSIRTFVAPHVGKQVVLRMDIREFFPTFGGVRIQNFFRTLGYPEAVADLLGGICTNATPRAAWKDISRKVSASFLNEMSRFYARPHLPQGAPSSPALANSSFYRVDCRLAGLAKSAGAVYARYADDLAFSGDEKFAESATRFPAHVAALLLEEGFRINHRKTRLMRQGVRQQLAGIVANQKLNIRRTEFDRLKAVLTNCIRFGPESQNRERHPEFQAQLHGKVSFVEMIHPERGRRLRGLFEKVDWH